MSKLKPISPKKLLKIIQQMGFEKIRQNGSHNFFRHPDGRSTVIPIHPQEDIGRGLLIEILKDIELTRQEFQKLIK